MLNKKIILCLLFLFLTRFIALHSLPPFFIEENKTDKISKYEKFSAKRKGLGGIGSAWEKANTVGEFNVLVLLVETAGTPFTVSKTISDFTSHFFETNRKGTPSVRDYYFETSYGKMSFSGKVFGIYKSAYYSSHYASSSYSARDMLTFALGAFQTNVSNIDLSLFDNNEDGFIDNVFVIHSGAGYETSKDNDSSLILSHWWELASPFRLTNSKDGNVYKASSYVLSAEIGDPGNLSYAKSPTTTIGIWAHEMLHALGLPDLYDTSGVSDGLGVFDIMAYGCYNYLKREEGIGSLPSHMNAYIKYRLGWLELKPLKKALYNELNAFEDYAFAYVLRKNDRDDEFFVVENRRRKGFDRGLPGEGLLIWHVDESVYNANLLNNRVNANVFHKAIDLEEADGIENLDDASDGDRGNYADFWRASYEGFSKESTPSSHYYDGRESGFTIVAISDARDVVTFGEYKETKKALVSYPSVFSYSENKKITFKFYPERGDFDSFAFSSSQSIKVRIFNESGREIKVLEGFTENYKFEWNVLDENNLRLPLGFYFYTIDVGMKEAFAGSFLIKYR